MSFTGTMPMSAPAPMRIELEDPTPHAQYLEALSEDLMRDNVKVDAVMLPVKAYFSMQAFIDARGYGKYSGSGRGMEFMGMKILMDPRRDSGPPTLIFDDENALRVLSRRKK